MGRDDLYGEQNADSFVLDFAALSDAHAATPVVDTVGDYDQGDTFHYSATELDVIDVAPIVSDAYVNGNQNADALARVVEDPGNSYSLVQVDPDGIVNGILWTTIAQVEGIHSGQSVGILLTDASNGQSTGIDRTPLSNDGHFGDFDGSGTSDLLWHNDNGANAVWLMDHAGNASSSAFFDGVGSEWHVIGTGDVDGDHKEDVVWRDDSGATAIWLMNGGGTPTVAFPGGVPNDWTAQAHHYEYV